MAKGKAVNTGEEEPPHFPRGTPADCPPRGSRLPTRLGRLLLFDGRESSTDCSVKLSKLFEAPVSLEEEPSDASRQPKKSLRGSVVLLLGTVLFVAVAFQLISAGFSSPVEENVQQHRSKAKEGSSVATCDLFSGEWIKDPSSPAYTNSSCLISIPQDCLTNGRPDTDYLHWRWKPYGCELPPLDARKLLNKLRNKSLAFIGDSILRNQMESLVCLLSEVEGGVIVDYDESWQTVKRYLPSYNITLGLIWAPFLLNSTEAQTHVHMQLYLDALDDSWTSQFEKYDYILISGGQWFLKETIFLENNTVIGCHYCVGLNLTELGMDYSYVKALRLTFDFMSTSNHRPLVIYRTWTPSHFEHGEWYNGGICHRTMPFKEGDYTDYPVDLRMRDVELEAVQEGIKNGLRLKLLDVYHLSTLRPDGHPGPFRRLHPDLSERPQEDCLHWCLPGAIDAWNDLLAKILMEEEAMSAAF